MMGKRYLQTVKIALTDLISILWLHFTCRKDRLLLICNRGIGDALFIAFFVDELKERYKKKLYVLCKDHSGEIFRSYDSVDKICANTRLANWIGRYCLSTQQIFSERYIYCHFKDAEKVLSEAHDNILKVYHHDILHMGEDVYPRFPHFTYTDSMIRDIRTRNRLDKDTILIAPYASSSENLNMDFWARLAVVLKTQGFKVKTNCAVNEKPIDGTECFRGTLMELACMASLCVAVIAFRSGICDWLACTDCKLIVLNTNRWNKGWDVNNFSKRPVRSIEYDREKENEVIQRIKMCVM